MWEQWVRHASWHRGSQDITFSEKRQVANHCLLHHRLFQVSTENQAIHRDDDPKEGEHSTPGTVATSGEQGGHGILKVAALVLITTRMYSWASGSAQWQSDSLACTRPWAPSPALEQHKHCWEYIHIICVIKASPQCSRNSNPHCSSAFGMFHQRGSRGHSSPPLNLKEVDLILLFSKQAHQPLRLSLSKGQCPTAAHSHLNITWQTT